MATPAPTFHKDAPTLGDGRYVLVSRIGQGGVGAVYRAYDRKLRVWRAVKVLLAEAAGHDWVREQFDNDARVLAQIEHPNLLRVYDVGEAGGLPYVVMELVNGGALVRWSAQYGPMPPRVASEVVQQVLSALAAVHAYGVVHGGVKPGNLLVTPNGTAKLTDFGIVAPPEGTGHAAPEQLDGSPIDARADLYCVGTTLWHLLRGQDPRGRSGDYAGIDSALVPVIRRATADDRNHRYDSAEALGSALEDASARLLMARIGSPDLCVDRSEDELVVTPHAFGELEWLLDDPAAGGFSPEPQRHRPVETPSVRERVARATSAAQIEPDPYDDPVEYEEPTVSLRATPAQAVTPPPPEVARPRTATPAPPPSRALPVPEPEESPSRLVTWVVVPAALLVASLICVALVVVVVGGAGMASLSDAADAATERQVHLYRVLNEERGIVEELAALGADRGTLEQAYIGYLDEDVEPARLGAALTLVRTVDTEAKGHIDAQVEGTQHLEVAQTLKAIRDARSGYEGAVTRWRAAARAPTGRALVAVGLGPTPPFGLGPTPPPP